MKTFYDILISLGIAIGVFAVLAAVVWFLVTLGALGALILVCAIMFVGIFTMTYGLVSGRF